MPSPWKKARIAGVARFISGLRSKRAGSSLVVETGFPTSLADLVVKNRDRLKKPTWRKKPSPASDPGSDMAPAPAFVRPPPNSGAPKSGIGEAPRPPAFEEIRRPAPVPVGYKSRGCGCLFGFPAAKMLVLVVLVAGGSKKLVAGITISAFALFLLEILGFRVLEFLRPCSDARRSLNSVAGGLEFRGRELVSPIREVGLGNSSGSLRSGMSSVESPRSDRTDEVPFERKAARVDRNAGCSGKSKMKTLWWKLVPKKFRKGTVMKDVKEHVLVERERGVSVCDREEDGGVSKDQEEEEEEQSDERALRFRASDKASQLDTEDVRENVGRTRLGSSRKLVFLVVVLLGLTGGRVVAMFVTAAWYLLAQLMEFSWRKCKVRKIN